ncbi:hypothetical protein ACHAXS_000733 [Conticribra weissflogii]
MEIQKGINGLPRVSILANQLLKKQFQIWILQSTTHTWPMETSLATNPIHTGGGQLWIQIHISLLGYIKKQPQNMKTSTKDNLKTAHTLHHPKNVAKLPKIPSQMTIPKYCQRLRKNKYNIF